MQVAQEISVELLPIELQGDLVDRGDIGGGDDRFGIHVAEEGNLVLDLFRDLLFSPAEDDVGADADLPKLVDGMLRGLRLELFRGPDIGDQCQVHIGDVVLPDLPGKLPDCLEEGEGLDVAHRSADLHKDDVGFGSPFEDDTLDFIGDVRNHLDGSSEELASALPGDDVVIDPSGRVVILFSHGEMGKAFVVAQVKIRFRAVIGYIDLSVLVGVHRAGVDIDVGIELEEVHPVSAAFEKTAQRGGGNSLAEGGDHSPCDEDIFHRDCRRASLRYRGGRRLPNPAISFLQRAIVFVMRPSSWGNS